MKAQKIMKVFPVFLLLFMLFSPNLAAQGHFEFGFHYSSWSIDILRGLIEEGLGDALETNLKDNFLEEIQEDYPGLLEDSYDQDVSFDSTGSNYGFEVRWYPGGNDGSFSLGLSVEKTSMTISIPELSAALALTDQTTSESANFQASAGGEFLINPLSFHLSFRWDIVPSWPVHPYFTFGVGAATGTALEVAEFSYHYTGDLSRPGEATEHYEDQATKTLQQLKDEIEEEGDEFFLPGFIPFIQLNLGIKAKISENIHLMVDAGIWDGFLLRGGIAIRL